MALKTTDQFEDHEDQSNDPDSSSSDPLVGTVFAEKYEIQSVIGSGGMATVYKARHKYMERIVAVKILKNELVSNPLSRERFKKESKAASVLSHPNIITVFDFGVDKDETAFLVMDYLEGTTLGDVIDSNGPLAESDALTVFRQVAKGLIHAHKRNVIHRDLKPRNLVLTVEDDGSVLAQIVDFGIAKMIEIDGDQSNTLTQTGEVFGSPIYMSPEQCEGDDLDVRSDIYSLGCVMYESLMGIPPFLGKNPMETMSMHLEDEPQPFSQLNAERKISKKLEKIVFKCLAKDPDERFETAKDLLEALPVPKENGDINDGTKVMTLSQIVAQSSTKLSKVVERAPQKRKRIKHRLESKTLAIVFGVALLAVSSFICLYPGPEEDPGAPLFKMKWQLLMTLADVQIKNKQYENALPLLDWALADARNLSGDTKNYDKIFETLIKQVKVYSSLGMSEKQKEAVDLMSSLEKEKWISKTTRLISKLKEAKRYINDLKKQNKNPKNFRDKQPLNLKGDSTAVIALAKRLDLVQEYNLQEDLLELYDELFSELYGKDYIELADIKLQLAECLRKEDQIQEITQLKLYDRVVEIEKRNLSREELKPYESAGYIRALLKLGQWQRDRSIFSKAGKNLLEAISLAEKSRSISKKELMEYYNSYADYLRQTGNNSEAEAYQTKAKKLKVKHYKTPLND